MFCRESLAASVFLSVLSGSTAGDGAKDGGEVGERVVAHILSDHAHRQIGLLQQPHGKMDSLLADKITDGASRFAAEVGGEIRGREAHMLRQLVSGDLSGNVIVNVMLQAGNQRIF